MEVPSVAKDDKIVDAGLRLPRTKTSSFELQLQLQRGTRGGERSFPAVKRFIVRYENTKQSKSKLGLLLHCGQLPIAADFAELPESLQKSTYCLKTKTALLSLRLTYHFVHRFSVSAYLVEVST